MNPPPDQPQPPATPEEDGSRTRENVLILVFAIAVIGAGIWLVDALLAARKADECLSAGRRNCSPITLPAGER
jgi:hypothetical protein